MSETVYVAEAGNAIKIGVSETPEKRVEQLNTGNPHNIELREELTHLQDQGRTAREWESLIHEHLSEYSLSGEWFEIEALDELHEFVGSFKTDVELTDRQSHALGVAFTLQQNLPSNLYQYDINTGDVLDYGPEEQILQVIVDEYDLPHGVCRGCARLAYHHTSEDGETCQICGTKKQ